MRRMRINHARSFTYTQAMNNERRKNAKKGYAEVNAVLRRFDMRADSDSRSGRESS
jgi:hypothetical protein